MSNALTTTATYLWTADYSGAASDVTRSSGRSVLGLSFAPAEAVVPEEDQLFGDSMIAGAGGQVSFANQWRQNKRLPSVYNGGVGGETSTQVKDRYMANSARHDKPLVIWAGRNNYSSTSTVLSDIATMVAAHTAAREAAGKTARFIVISILNGSASDERLGQTGYNSIISLNSQLASAYGDAYLELREYLVSQYNPSVPQDVTDHADDTVPSSLRIDGLHLTTAGLTLALTQALAKFDQVYGTPDGVLRASDLRNTAFAIRDVTGSITIRNGSLLFRTSDLGGIAGLYSTGSGNAIAVAGGLIPYNNDVDLGATYPFQFRNGYFSGTLLTPTVRGTTATGSNATGETLKLNGGYGTGTATSGSVDLGTVVGGASGSTANTTVVVAGRFDASTTANDTRFLVYDVTAGTLQRVTIGAADSGGAGYRVLRIPN